MDNIENIDKKNGKKIVCHVSCLQRTFQCNVCDQITMIEKTMADQEKIFIKMLHIISSKTINTYKKNQTLL